eukprot:TRINITY_DN2546_c0_g1_i1.p2 TRINITY_DN2546_c0_g1~~TRINITY_DN2546_c0_g1_i1.p2  ORF type:complete len:171 (-),score=61.93 TRINITY_DN2546_c0_g1_i1:513-1025(-)
MQPLSPPPPVLADGETHMELVGDSGFVYGAAVCTKGSSKVPTFISPGHLISTQSSITAVDKCSVYRIPEPVRQADLRSREWIRDNLADLAAELEAEQELREPGSTITRKKKNMARAGQKGKKGKKEKQRNDQHEKEKEANESNEHETETNTKETDGVDDDDDDDQVDVSV